MNRRQKIAMRVAKNIVFLNHCKQYMEFFRTMIPQTMTANRSPDEEAMRIRSEIIKKAKDRGVSVNPLIRNDVTPELIEIVGEVASEWIRPRDQKEKEFRMAALRRQRESTIEKVGHTVQLVGSDDKEPSFAYSVGRNDRGLKDFLIYPNNVGGLGAGVMIDFLAKKFDEEGDIKLDTVYEDSPLICAKDGKPTKYKICVPDPKIVEKTMLSCIIRPNWKSAESSALQIVLADENNEFAS